MLSRDGRSVATLERLGVLEPLPVTAPPDPAEVDHNLYLDFLTRKLMRAWTEREETPPTIPWTPLRKLLAESTVAFVSSAGVACVDDVPFDQDHERRDPWWGELAGRSRCLSSGQNRRPGRAAR